MSTIILPPPSENTLRANMRLGRQQAALAAFGTMGFPRYLDAVKAAEGARSARAIAILECHTDARPEILP